MHRIPQFLACLAFALPGLAQAQSPGHFVKDGEPRWYNGNEAIGRVLVGTEESGDEFVIMTAESPNPLKTPLHIHNEHHEALYVLSGRLRVTIDTLSRELEIGDFVFMPKAIQHRLEILEPSRILVVASEGYEEARTEIFALLSDGVPMKEVYEQLPFLEYVSD